LPGWCVRGDNAPSPFCIDTAAVNRFPFYSPLFVLALLVAGCAPLMPQPPRTTLAVSRVASPNFDERRPTFVIIHHTSDDTLDEALTTLTSPVRKVSAHYLIGRDGRIVQLVEENARAWHAGKSWWGGHADINSASLGIELDNNGDEPFADTQIDALLALLADLRQRYHLPAANFIAHADVAPGRKADPSALFPWPRLADQGFGLWCDLPAAGAPAGFDLTLALTALGYDPAVPEASRQAFLLHYARGDQRLSADQENALAFCLWQRKMSSRSQEGNSAGSHAGG
jgi:N-acetylmuramoyl-L-alanine amidase